MNNNTRKLVHEICTKDKKKNRFNSLIKRILFVQEQTTKYNNLKGHWLNRFQMDLYGLEEVDPHLNKLLDNVGKSMQAVFDYVAKRTDNKNG